MLVYVFNQVCLECSETRHAGVGIKPMNKLDLTAVDKTMLEHSGSM
jgi:hypothetical protein